jgi:hypothetical protein
MNFGSKKIEKDEDDDDDDDEFSVVGVLLNCGLGQM